MKTSATQKTKTERRVGQDVQDVQDENSESMLHPLCILSKTLLASFALFRGNFLLGRYPVAWCLICAVVLLCPIGVSAQIQQAWVAHYSNGLTNGTHQATNMALDSSGNIYATGFSQNTNGNLDYATIKYAPNGNQLWVARFDSTNTTTAKPAGLVLDPQGNVIVTGSAVTVKYDNNGNQLWTAPYAGAAIAGDTNSNIFVTGFDSNFTVVKMNSSGTNIWLESFSIALGYPSVGQALAADLSGDVYVAGSSAWYSLGGGNFYFQLTAIKYDANGNQIWYAYAQGDEAYRHVQVNGSALDSNGDFYIVYNANTADDYSTVKYGNIDGAQAYHAESQNSGINSQVLGLALDKSTNAFITGINASFYPTSYAAHPSAYGTYKIGANGSYLSTNNYPSIPTTTNVGMGLTVDQVNNVYVTGYSEGNGSGLDFVTIKYDNNLNQIWLQRYNGAANGDDVGNAIAVDASGNVYVTGYETMAGGGTEMVTIKYAPGPVIKKQTNGFMLLQAVGAANQNFDFQASTNIQTWQDLGIFSADSNGLVQFLDTNAPLYNARFYLTIPQ